MSVTKEQQLRKHKQWATGLFVCMTLLFFVCLYIQKNYNWNAIGYIKAFAEAAMVGALADWFAVTALFNYPMGLKLPHTNLIVKSKQQIGDNLGSFVVENFLNAKDIKPYIYKINASQWILSWASKSQNKDFVLKEIQFLIHDALLNLEDVKIAQFIEQKGVDYIQTLPLQNYISKGLLYIVQNNKHEALLTQIANKIIIVIESNRSLIKDKVQSESYKLVPKFVNQKLANKITDGLITYFDEVATDERHPIRKEIAQFIETYALQLPNDAQAIQKIENLKLKLLQSEQWASLALDIWLSIKKSLIEITAPQSPQFLTYLSNIYWQLLDKWQQDVETQRKIDQWIQKNALRIILSNTHAVGTLISNTVGQWDGEALSKKLELEIGKDLQFIRINGTIVGGIVGLIIYAIAQLVLNL